MPDASPPIDDNETTTFKRNARFWLVFVALCSCTLLSALDLGGIGTAAPTIVNDLNGSDFTWVASVYSLSSSSTILLSGHLAEIFGRSIIIMTGIIVFAVGSTISGSAQSLPVFIGGRAVQGVGSGAIQALNSIIITDLVPLRERGLYAGITGLVWTIGTVTGPFIAGSLAQDKTWRWFFYLNLPHCGIAFIIVMSFLRLKRPEGDVRQKLTKIDWLGNTAIIGSTCSCMLALTFGGIRFPWTSASVLVPLVLGLFGLLATLFYESRWPEYPVIPWVILSNRTSLSGYLATFIQGVVTLGIVFYLPTWFQSVKAASPILSGLYILPLAVAVPLASIAQGYFVSKTGCYRRVNLFGWCSVLLGTGLLISLKLDTSIGLVVLYQLVTGVGLGFLYSTTFPILAPLPLKQNASAVAFMTFLRQCSQAWGVSIGGTILQNSLTSRLPNMPFIDVKSHEGGQLAYSIIPQIPKLPADLKLPVQTAYLQSLRQLWVAFTIFGALGMATVFMMKSYPLKRVLDAKWGIEGEAHDDLAMTES
ncbi:hypothetical protein GALMADRAFT_143106 [Galerina marginata CBS 339.88]|uniref:Major facilitator superfamily (MFS) profile domain-containing protein n=1 Tax=Galerina marginata (strain CBS 339.88) TaxID=685588 RepID=A0A067SQC2_GALM3|nr:hypothetical protein GALMADRAFT_143106 [Galerina marginata CBS 339.88]